MIADNSKVKKPLPEVLAKTISACIANGQRLSDESYDLEFREPPSLQFYILLIAQEELAKAFILLLVRDGIIPFNRYLLRAMNDHTCKHLVGVIMDYIIIRYEDIFDANGAIRTDCDFSDQLPPAVQSAIVLLRFEKIGRWESYAWDWTESPEYDSKVKKIAEGQTDRRKQDALYVRIGRDGSLCLPQAIKQEYVDQEKERALEFRFLITSLFNGDNASYRYDKAISLVRDMFAQSV